MPLPLGVVVHPMADEYCGRQVPVVQLSSAGIVRCRRCRTYMNPFIQWTDAGRRCVGTLGAVGALGVCARLQEEAPECDLHTASAHSACAQRLRRLA